MSDEETSVIDKEVLHALAIAVFSELSAVKGTEKGDSEHEGRRISQE